MIAISLVVLPHYTRLTRAAVITELSKDYVVASKVSGAGVLRLMFITVLPNCTAPLIVQATVSVSYAILGEASLSFLGLGQQPPAPSWGSMLNAAQRYLSQAPWMALYPGLMIFAIVMALNVLGDGLRDALDPKQQ
jgi:dipeptide transport system permease protein